MLPAASDPIPNGEHFVAINPASPPDEPPVVRSLLYGLREIPHILL